MADVGIQHGTVGEEHRIELRRFGLLRDRGVVLDAVARQTVGGGEPPGSAEHAGIEYVDVQMQLHSHDASTPVSCPL